MGWIRSAAQAAVDFLVEPRCHACGGAVRPGSGHPLATPLRVGAGPLFVETHLLCPACAERTRRWRRPVRLRPRRRSSVLHVFPGFVTDDIVLRLIHLLKFERQRRIAPWLGHAIADGCPRLALRDVPAPPVLVPVPLDRRARRNRGFNQAEAIAGALAACWELPLAPRAIVKTRPTPPQSSLGRSERARNLTGALAASADSVAGMTAILVDDLVTTGATALACAAILTESGAASVRVVCVGYRP